MEKHQISTNLVKEIELAEARNWSELCLSASKNLRVKLGIHSNIISGAFCGALSQVDTLAFNRVLGFGLDYDITKQQVQSIIHFYKKVGTARFFVQLCPGAKPEHATQILTDSGFSYYNNWAKFYKKLDTPIPPSHSNFSIEKVGYNETDEFDNIIKKAFNWQDGAALLTSQTIDRPGWRHYFAKDGNKPVAAAAMYYNGRFASLAISGTLPEYRGCGAQSSLVTKRINDAKSAGCEYMVVETAEDRPENPSASNRNMKRFGFEQAYLRPNYIYFTA